MNFKQLTSPVEKNKDYDSENTKPTVHETQFYDHDAEELKMLESKYNLSLTEQIQLISLKKRKKKLEEQEELTNLLSKKLLNFTLNSEKMPTK